MPLDFNRDDLTLYYTAFMPMMIGLRNLRELLVIATKHLGKDPELWKWIMMDRLAVDQVPLKMHILIPFRKANEFVEKLTGLSKQKGILPDRQGGFNLNDIDDMLEATDELVQWLVRLDPESIESHSKKTLTLRINPDSTYGLLEHTVEVPPIRYLIGHVIPHMYFHHVSAYSIFRLRGLALHKQDFMSGRLRNEFDPITPDT